MKTKYFLKELEWKKMCIKHGYTFELCEREKYQECWHIVIISKEEIKKVFSTLSEELKDKKILMLPNKTAKPQWVIKLQDVLEMFGVEGK